MVDMSERSIVRNDDGVPTHIREVSDDRRSSTLYEYDDSLLSGLWDHRGPTVEVAEHQEDGTSQAYEYDNSLFSNLWDHKGAKK
jgi:hypothetical protein